VKRVRVRKSGYNSPMPTPKTPSLTPPILAVVAESATERPFSGEYNDFGESGTYLCRRCGLVLFRSQTKFHSGCGWPSFDEEIPGAVAFKKDPDGLRTEILCARCHAHLGHVFAGEGFTAKNTRHCVNSFSLDFVANLDVTDTEEAIFAAGCFWGVEYLFKKLPGVLKTEVGYTGGEKEAPSYEDVCTGTSGHYEAIRIVYDPTKINYKKIAMYFFEIHNPTQRNGQGPDIGQQYQSAIFYYDDEQKQIAIALIEELTQLGFQVATALFPVSTFWPAEAYHQNYYAKTGHAPYCHVYTKKFTL
jgi:peptide methionine sulfoxide reductase msrA/msrB